MQGAFEHVCMFENPQPFIENETYTLKHTRSIFIEKPNKTLLKRLFVHVCMFENPLPVMENETYAFEHALSNAVKKNLKM